MRPASRSRRESARISVCCGERGGSGRFSSIAAVLAQQSIELALRALPLRRRRALVRATLAEQRRACHGIAWLEAWRRMLLCALHGRTERARGMLRLHE